jgi:hypothetical protein
VRLKLAVAAAGFGAITVARATVTAAGVPALRGVAE